MFGQAGLIPMIMNETVIVVLDKEMILPRNKKALCSIPERLVTGYFIWC